MQRWPFDDADKEDGENEPPDVVGELIADMCLYCKQMDQQSRARLLDGKGIALTPSREFLSFSSDACLLSFVGVYPRLLSS